MRVAVPEVAPILHRLMAETVVVEQGEVAQRVMKPEFLDRPFTMLVVVGEQETVTVLTELDTETPQTGEVVDNLTALVLVKMVGLELSGLTTHPLAVV